MLRKSKIVGQIIKLEREKRKLTQKDLAEILNVSFQAISKWENGDGYPDLEKLVAISEIYHMTIDQLIVQTKDGYNPILEHQINQTINNNKLSISIEDFHILNDETIITLHLKNKTNQDIELLPYRFHLTGKHKKYIEPIKDDFPLTKKGNNETDNVERKCKHAVPKQLKAKGEIWVKLFYKDCSSYPEIYLYPKIIKDFSVEYFKISKAMYYGINQIITSPINMSKKYSTDDFKLIVEVLISKGLYKELRDFLKLQKQRINRFFVVSFGCSFLKNTLNLFETLIDPSAIEFIFQKRIFIDSEFIFKFGKTDNHIREMIKANLSEFEKQCKDDEEFMEKYFKDLKPFMDGELIFFISKMGLKYKKRIAPWTIPYFTQEWFEKLKEFLLEINPAMVIALYSSKVSEESVKQLIMEILMIPEDSKGPSVEQVDDFLRKTQHRLFSDDIEEIFIAKNISDLESLDLIRVRLSRATYEKLYKEITEKGLNIEEY